MIINLLGEGGKNKAEKNKSRQGENEYLSQNMRI